VSDRLAAMLNAQRTLQEKINGYSLESQTTEQRIANIKENVLALTDELHEVLGEMGWKSWATSRHLNRDAAVGEAIDAWHFLMNIFLHLGVDADELYTHYVAKRLLNEKRQTDGYTGLDKCPSCKRSLDEVQLSSSRRADGVVELAWCACGANLDIQLVRAYLID
jgi:dimeric dUTPase (all-alpha-NTP-PPase superfamily)